MDRYSTIQPIRHTAPDDGTYPQPDGGRSAILALTRLAMLDATTIDNLRRYGLGPDGICRDEADALFALEKSGGIKASAWHDLFVETITHYCVWDLRPTGVVNETQAEWLIEATDCAHSVNSIAVLVSVLEEAHRVPIWFPAAVKARVARLAAAQQEAVGGLCNSAVSLP